ncbi:MAG: hypothetical protein FD153_1414 [Rhodospirillaceae bacterium]|nr:MAG: hypothetical protein FD153_1414 [Rhodospirillaceae bacterium]
MTWFPIRQKWLPAQDNRVKKVVSHTRSSLPLAREWRFDLRGDDGSRGDQVPSPDGPVTCDCSGISPFAVSWRYMGPYGLDGGKGRWTRTVWERVVRSRSPVFQRPVGTTTTRCWQTSRTAGDRCQLVGQVLAYQQRRRQRQSDRSHAVRWSAAQVSSRLRVERTLHAASF